MTDAGDRQASDCSNATSAAGADAPAPTAANVAARLRNTALKLSELWPLYAADMKSEKRWKSDSDHAATRRLFVGICGDKPLSDCGPADGAAFRRNLLALPADYDKKHPWRKIYYAKGPMAVIEAAKQADVAKLSAKTFNKHYSAINPSWEWGRQNEALALSTASILEALFVALPKDKNASYLRELAGLQARCPPQSIVDSLLPTRPILLKMCNQVAVELDRHQFFRDRNATFSLRADGLSRWWRRWFEHSFGYGQGVGRSIPVRWSRHANSSIELLTDTCLARPLKSMGVAGKGDDRLYRNVCRRTRMQAESFSSEAVGQSDWQQSGRSSPLAGTASATHAPTAWSVGPDAQNSSGRNPGRDVNPLVDFSKHRAAFRHRDQPAVHQSRQSAAHGFLWRFHPDGKLAAFHRAHRYANARYA